jgi:uncharacterized protein YciI
MLFAILCFDKPARLDLRQATRPAHLAYLQSHAQRIVEAGPLLDAAGQPQGSLIVIAAADRAEAENFAANDPYTKAGLFESTLIRPYRAVFRNGALLE